MLWSLPAAPTKHQRLRGSQTTEICGFQPWRLRSPRSWCWQSQCRSCEDSLPGSQTPTFSLRLPGRKGGGSRVSFTRDTNPAHQAAPSGPSRLAKALPLNTIPPRVRLQHTHFARHVATRHYTFQCIFQTTQKPVLRAPNVPLHQTLLQL